MEENKSSWLVLLLLLVLLLSSTGTNNPVNPVGPITEPGLKVLIGEESDLEHRAALTEGQRAAMDATGPNSLRAYVESKNGVMRVLDNDDNPEYLSDTWQKLFARVPKQDDAVPFLIISNYPKYYEGKMTGETEKEIVDLAKKWGGN